MRAHRAAFLAALLAGAGIVAAVGPSAIADQPPGAADDARKNTSVLLIPVRCVRIRVRKLR